MPNEKLYTAKQAAEAVLAKASEMLSKSSKNTPWDQRPVHSGVHNASDHATGGQSFAGKDLKEGYKGDAKQQHTEKLATLKSMPKPNLGKTEETKSLKKEESNKTEWKPKKMDSPYVSSHEHDDRANSGRYHSVTTHDGSNYTYDVADHKTGQTSHNQPGGTFEEAKSKALAHKMPENKLGKAEVDAKLAQEVKENKLSLPKAAKIAPNPKEMFSDLRNKDIKKTGEIAKKQDLTKAQGPCWDGYEKVAGKAKFSEGSCKPVKKAEGAPAEKDQSGPDGVQKETDPATPNDKVNGNPAPGALPQNQVKYAAEGGTKGHIKLAKFVGAIEQKRKMKAAPAPVAAAPEMDKAETGYEKGVHRSIGGKNSKQGSLAGSTATAAKKYPEGTHGPVGSHIAHGSVNIKRAKETHKKVLGEMKSMPKPNLGKAEGEAKPMEAHGKKLLGK